MVIIKQVKPYDLCSLLSYSIIRFKVFIKEYKRNILEEFSLNDIKAEHYLFMKGNKAIGIARVLYKENIAELGRVAIIKEYRDKGYGTKFINQLILHIEKQNKAKLMSLIVAERSLTKFYKQFGFIENGEVYFDDTPYVNMVKAFETIN